MRFQFLMVPALLAASPAAFADEYMTLAQAQQAIFPGASFTSADLTLSGEQVDQLSQRTQVTVFHSKVKAWKVSTGGWFFLDQVLGPHYLRNRVGQYRRCKRDRSTCLRQWV
jgi:hypothetical protein